MENEQSSTSLFDFNIDSTAATQLSSTGWWAKFIAIFSWVSLAAVAIFILFFGTALNTVFSKFFPFGRAFDDFMDSGVFTIFAFIMVVVCAVAALYVLLIYRFGTRLQKATENQDQEALEGAFASFKIYLIITGVLGIIGAAVTLLSVFF